MTNQIPKMLCILSFACLASPAVAEPQLGLTIVLNANMDGAFGDVAKACNGLVHGLVRDSATVETLNRQLLENGQTGRVTVGEWDGTQIPFVSETVNVLVSDKAEITNEMRRVVAPYGRITNRTGKTSWQKPWPNDLDEWTHYLHSPNNNAVGQDQRVGAPRRIKWLAGPQMSRHHDHLPSLSAMVTSRGRIFYIFDEAESESILFPPKWRLIARDASNGLVLWKKEIANWHPHLWPLKSMPATLPRRLVSVGDDLFVTLGVQAPVTQLSGVDGSEKTLFAGSERCEEIIVTEGLVITVCLSGKGPLDDLVDDARGKKLDPRATKFPKVRRLMAGVMSPYWLNAERRIIAFDRETGSKRWQHDTKCAPLSLASSEGRVFFHDSKSVVSLDAETGKKLWTSVEVPLWDKFQSWYGVSLVIHQDVVLFSGGENMTSRPTGTPSGARDSMTAFSAKDGKKLWKGEHLASGYRSPEDLFVAQGLVWAPDSTGKTKSLLKGLDPHTGEVQRELDIDFRQGFHHRCYAGRATERYMIASKVGINLVDFGDGAMSQDNWVRGSCGYGIMPANGVIYSTPDPCNCFPESKLNGFAALAGADADLTAEREKSASTGTLERGTQILTEALDVTPRHSDQWPTYRGDAARSGASVAKLPVKIEPSWKCDLNGKLTAPVVADGKVFVASIEDHQVVAVDAKTGQVVWSHIAGGRVDSPPTVVGRRLYFGSADGTLTCLETSAGHLQWRRRLAPTTERIVSSGRLESVWPVHGSVLYHNKLLYAVAGRSMFVDGGLMMFAIEPVSGEIVHQERHHLSGEKTRGLDTTPAMPDVLSGYGKMIGMRSMSYDLDCQKSDRTTAHLFASNGFLNDTYFDRSFWTYSDKFSAGSGGTSATGNRYHSGRILVCDKSNLYGFGRTRYGWGSAFQYKLYRTKTPPSLPPSQEKKQRADREKRRGDVKQTDWSVDVPILVSCMVKAGDQLLLAGPKRHYAEVTRIQQLDTPEARSAVAAQAEAWSNSGELVVVSAKDGIIERVLSLGFAPVWDGVAVAGQRIFIAGKDGSLRCFD